MYRVPVRPPSGVAFATHEASSLGGSSRPNQPRAQFWVKIWRDKPCYTVPIIALSCCLLLALSGCAGGFHLVTPPDTAVLSALSCTGASLTGSGTDTCTVTLNASAPSGGVTVTLWTSSTAVTVPAAVTIPANASSVGVMATVAPVTTSQAVTLTATVGSVSKSFVLRLNVNGTTQVTPPISWSVPAAIKYGTALSATQLDASSTVAGTFSYTPAVGTVLKVGVQTLSVTFTPTDATDFATATATVALNVNRATPTITWAVPAAITDGTALSASQLDASSTVAGTFAYTPDAGTVLNVGAQTLSATFTPTDATNYTTATASVTLTVKSATKSTPAITWAAPAAVTYGTALSSTQLDASSTAAGTFAYTPAVGTVLKSGPQTLSVTFTPTDTTDYTTATATVALTVNQATPAITWPAPAAITYGTALSATQLDASSIVPGTFAYSPAAGTVLKPGAETLSVTFTPTDSTDYKAATATVTLTVKSATQSTPAITWATPAAITYSTALSATQLDASSTVAGTFAYTPAAGTVLKAGAQTLSVTFAPTDTTDYTTATATVALTVNQATPAITWPAPAAITYGTALSATQLNASSTVAGSFAYTPAVGTVLKSGTQTLSVTFTPTDTTDYTTATASAALAVNQATPAITWPAPATITYGTALSATQLDASSTVAGSFAYTPAAGTVLNLGAQTLSVTFTPTDSSDYKAAMATVTLIVKSATQSTPTITWTPPAAITYGTALSSTQLDASATVAGTFVYTPAAGTVLKAGAQTLSVTFTPTDTTDYSTATATVALTVNQATPAITWAAPAAITYGTPLSATQLDASSTVAGTFAYTPAAGTVLKAGAQTLSVTFSPTDTTDYTTATASVALTVNQATPTIKWPAPAAITYGTPLSTTQLDASSTVAGTFAYSPPAGTVLNAGAQTLSVNFAPTDLTDYKAATATVTLTVKPATQSTPAISWTAPAAISYGTALSGTQLYASSTVAGTFAYTPAAGTVLKAGTQTLSATFTPTDTTDYTTATATVALTVNQATPTVTWPAPAAITYGTALSSTQLDASSTILGAFVYSPASGTVLAVGPQTLSVTFTPTDTTDYTTASQTVTLTVNQSTSTLTINTTSVGFGNVALNTPATQSVILSSTGTASVTVNSAALTGTGFTMSGPTFPATLTPGQTATLNVEFDPTATGAATGSLTITSTSSSNGTVVIPLTGTGVASSYAVDLSWDAPTSSAEPVAGYNVYRSPSGSSTYQLLNSSVETQTTYVDSTVQDGQSYDYIVESVDDSGVESTPTSPVAVSIP
jgi:centrosomal CEP192-like protein